jgi:hypothetical protein
MSIIEIKKIIEAQRLDIRQVAAELFPEVGFPMLALQRILNGKGDLTSSQVVAFSKITGLPIGFLYSNKKWKIQSIYKPSNRDILKFTSGEVWCFLDTDSATTDLFLPNSNKNVASIRVKTVNVPLSVYLSEISDIIIKHYQLNKY